MDEITLINLLNKITELNSKISWQLESNYKDPSGESTMEILLFQAKTDQKAGWIRFSMDNGKVIAGKYKGMVAFSRSQHLTEVLLYILHYEHTKKVTSLN